MKGYFHNRLCCKDAKHVRLCFRSLSNISIVFCIIIFEKVLFRLLQGYSTSVASGPKTKITGGVRAAQNIDQIMAKN